MGKHLTKEEWIKYFDLYEKGDYRYFWNTYLKETNKDCNTSKKIQNLKSKFRAKYRSYKTGNKNIIVSMSGKSKGPGKGRPKKQQEINWDNFNREELIEIAKRYNEITKNKSKAEKHKESLRTEDKK